MTTTRKNIQMCICTTNKTQIPVEENLHFYSLFTNNIKLLRKNYTISLVHHHPVVHHTIFFSRSSFSMHNSMAHGTPSTAQSWWICFLHHTISLIAVITKTSNCRLIDLVQPADLDIAKCVLKTIHDDVVVHH